MGADWLGGVAIGGWICCTPIIARAATDAAIANPVSGFIYFGSGFESGASIVGSVWIDLEIFWERVKSYREGIRLCMQSAMK